MSQESSADIVREAFQIGALGYVSKTQAGIDLLAAVDVVSQGMQFVSDGLARPVPPELAGEQPSKLIQRDEAFTTARQVGD